MLFKKPPLAFSENKAFTDQNGTGQGTGNFTSTQPNHGIPDHQTGDQEAQEAVPQLPLIDPDAGFNGA